jgi:hypothetical protein
MFGKAIDVTNSTEDGALVLNATIGGTATDILTVGGTAAGALQMRAHSSYSPADNLDLATKTYVDNTVSAAGDTIVKLNSSVVVTDTGSDGKITFTNDGVEVGSFDSAVFTAADLSITGSTLASSGSDVTVGDNLIVTGNLTVNGTTSTTNSTTVTSDDPIFTLGGDSAPGSDDGKDRGIEFRYHDGTAAKLGFFGYDDSTGLFTFLTTAANNSEVFSGTKGGLDIGDIKLSGSIKSYDGATPATGQILIGHSGHGDMRLATITAGPGIDVTNGDGAITIGAESASATNAGIVELATTAEALAGVDTTRAFTPAGLAARSFVGTIGDGSATSIQVSHGLSTRNVIVQLYDAATYDTVITDVVRTTSAVVTLTFATAPTSNAIKVLITKID